MLVYSHLLISHCSIKKEKNNIKSISRMNVTIHYNILLNLACIIIPIYKLLEGERERRVGKQTSYDLLHILQMIPHFDKQQPARTVITNANVAVTVTMTMP